MGAGCNGVDNPLFNVGGGNALANNEAVEVGEAGDETPIFIYPEDS